MVPFVIRVRQVFRGPHSKTGKLLGPFVAEEWACHFKLNLPPSMKPIRECRCGFSKCEVGAEANTLQAWMNFRTTTRLNISHLVREKQLYQNKYLFSLSTRVLYKSKGRQNTPSHHLQLLQRCIYSVHGVSQPACCRHLSSN